MPVALVLLTLAVPFSIILGFGIFGALTVGRVL